ncbi:amidohydrolase family protein [Bradyrhizobium sp. LHD-71]|uniref:amidohydrolase family protein n=1 Tax=Bradyrhizobium sp. LHD-71 TaxID=3072141 RepID=UPI00280EE19B|nr:amidohydrolase family protein [Bradyrhizobium sp. LHD-71]MDQ8731044.1 amidohydrolase family protein [Bradyrhizobium sp. LHD-71]
MSQDVIDVHAHILPDAYLEAMRDAGLANARGQVVGDGFPFPVWSLEDTLCVMERHRVRASVLSITAPGVQFLKGAAARRLARLLNEAMADIVRAHSTRFAALAVLPLSDVEASLQEVGYALDELHLDGVGLYSNVDGVYLGDPRFERLLAELNRREAVLFIHPAQPPAFAHFGLGLPSPILEYPFDSTRMLASLLYSGALARYQRIKLIVPHGGGAVPYLASRIARAASAGFQKGVRTAPDEAMRLLRTVHYDLTAMGEPGNLALLKEFVPVDRLLVGYDYPFRPEATIAPQASTLDAFEGFTDAGKTLIKAGNAMRLFPRLATS